MPWQGHPKRGEKVKKGSYSCETKAPPLLLQILTDIKKWLSNQWVLTRMDLEMGSDKNGLYTLCFHALR